jgi:hypothetical protein
VLVSDTFEARRSAAARVRARLLDAVDGSLGDHFASGVDDRLDVGHFVLLERCPMRAVHPPDDYTDTTANVRRRIGLAALRVSAALPDGGGGNRGGGDVGEADLDLGSAVTEALSDRSEWPAPLRQWFDGLDPAGRVAVRGVATTWAADVIRLVGRRRIHWSDPFRPLVWTVPGRAVRLRASVDGVIGRPRTGEKLLVVSDAAPGPGDRLRAGFVAVVHALWSGVTAVRVSIGSPAAGRVQRFDVDEALTDLAVDRLLEVLRYLAEPSAAPAVPGEWCRHCHLRDVCETGLGHLSDRFAG